MAAHNRSFQFPRETSKECRIILRAESHQPCYGPATSSSLCCTNRLCPMTELKSYDLPQLEALAEQIKSEIGKREREEEERARRAVEDATAEAERAETAAKEAAAEAERAARAAEAERQAREAAAQAVRYMHPSNRALTWSGVGPKPDWVNAWLVTGGTLYALEVAAEKLAPRPIPESFKTR